MVHRGGKNPHRYYCSTRREKGTCKNGRGILKKSLDNAVRARLHEVLTDDEEMNWLLITERAAQWRRDTAQPIEVRQNTEKELSRVEAEVARLVEAIASGKQSKAIVAAIEAKEAEAEGLKVKLVEAPEFNPDRAALRRAGLAYVGPLASGHAPAVRTILRRLNVERIVVIPDGPKGWRFESNVDLAGLLGQDGDFGGPPQPPALGDAPAPPRRPSISRRNQAEAAPAGTGRTAPHFLHVRCAELALNFLMASSSSTSMLVTENVVSWSLAPHRSQNHARPSRSSGRRLRSMTSPQVSAGRMGQCGVPARQSIASPSRTLMSRGEPPASMHRTVMSPFS